MGESPSILPLHNRWQHGPEGELDPMKSQSHPFCSIWPTNNKFNRAVGACKQSIRIRQCIEPPRMGSTMHLPHPRWSSWMKSKKYPQSLMRWEVGPELRIVVKSCGTTWHKSAFWCPSLALPRGFQAPAHQYYSAFQLTCSTTASSWMLILVADTVLSCGIDLQVFHAPGVHNEIANALSHLQNDQLTSLHSEVVILTFQPPQVTLGAARLWASCYPLWLGSLPGLLGPWNTSLFSIP